MKKKYTRQEMIILYQWTSKNK